MKRFLITSALFLTLTILALLPHAARAQDEGLYDPAPPEGSAFVRLINAMDSAAALAVDGKKLNKTESGTVGAYVPFASGKVNLSVSAITAAHELAKGGFYSALFYNGALIVVADTAIANPAKSQIAFYNFTPAPASLKTADGKAEIVAVTAPGESGYREINPVEITLGAFTADSADKPAAQTGPVILKRGVPMAVLFLPQDGALTVLTLKTFEARTNTKR